MQSNRSIRKSKSHKSTLRNAIVTVATTFACIAFAATPASAGNEFKDGFEDQLGRLVAFEALRAGKIALFAPIIAAKAHHDRVFYGDRDRRYDRYDNDNRYYDKGDYDQYYEPRQRYRKHVEPTVVAVHYHYGNSSPCSVVHGGHGYRSQRDHAWDRHWKHKKARKHNRRHHRRHH